VYRHRLRQPPQVNDCGAPYAPIVRLEAGMSPPAAFSYIGSFLSRLGQCSLLQAVGQLPFAHVRFRGQQLKRLYAQFGYAHFSVWPQAGAGDSPMFSPGAQDAWRRLAPDSRLRR
jgi:hypothetical protein